MPQISLPRILLERLQKGRHTQPRVHDSFSPRRPHQMDQQVQGRGKLKIRAGCAPSKYPWKTTRQPPFFKLLIKFHPTKGSPLLHSKAKTISEGTFRHYQAMPLPHPHKKGVIHNQHQDSKPTKPTHWPFSDNPTYGDRFQHPNCKPTIEPTAIPNGRRTK